MFTLLNTVLILCLYQYYMNYDSENNTHILYLSIKTICPISE